jgi:uncharacterized membrane protein YbaN (DUF454 family)
MNETVQSDPASLGTVCKIPAAGRIRIFCPALFATPDDATLHILMERLFHVSAVQVVTVHRQQTAIEIQFDRTAFDAQTALRTLSERLLVSDGPREESLMHQYFSRIPGKVNRVERHLPVETIPRGDSPLHPAESLLIVENLIVEYDPVQPAQEAGPLADVGAADSSVHPQVPGTLPHDVTRPWVGEVAVGGVRRIVNLTAAGGCLVMSIVGVITPGIPTVPFVLATGYFLSRSSPRLHEKFRRAPLFGPMLTDYEDLGGLRWSSKLKAITFTVGVMLITVILSAGSLPVTLLVACMGGLGLYMIARLPAANSAPA